MLRSGTRFGASIRDTNLLPRPCLFDGARVPDEAGQDVGVSGRADLQLIETASAMDAPIFEKLLNTGNTELKPDRLRRVPRPHLARPIRREAATTDTRRAIVCLACRAQMTKPTSMPPSQR